MPRVLTDGTIKLAVLDEKPANVGAPTASELAAGHDLSCAVQTSDFEFTAAASTMLTNKTLCQKGNAQRPGPKNHNAAITIYREYLDSGAPDAEDADKGFQVLKIQGTQVWVYARKGPKDSTEPWEAGDEIYMGGEFLTDTPTQGSVDDEIAVRVVLAPQDVHDYIAVATGSGGGS